MWVDMSPENKLSSVCIRVFFKVGNTEDGENLCHPICTLSDHTEKKVEVHSAFY